MNARAAVAGVILAALAVAGCGSSQAAAHHPPPRPVHLSATQTCQRLRADIVANGGTPDVPTLRYLAQHGPAWNFAGPGSVNAWQAAITNVQHPDGLGFNVGMDLAGFNRDCRATGVVIPFQSG